MIRFFVIFRPDITKLTWGLVYKYYKKGHENILNLIDILLTIPASSSEVERGFSQLKLIKTDMRSSLSESGLNDSMTIKLHSMPIGKYDPTEAIQLWNSSGVRARRPQLKDDGSKTTSTVTSEPFEPEESEVETDSDIEFDEPTEDIEENIEKLVNIYSTI
jgi:hypothetical protein